jgi:hypothetical protein
MTRRVALMAAMLVLFLLSAGAAQAEVRITVPFDFSVGKVLLPSGTYAIGKIGAAQTLLQLQNSKIKAGVIEQIHAVELDRGQVSQDDKLVFHRYGNQYFLAQFWVAGSATGFELRRTKVEDEIQNASKRRTEVLAARK